MILKGKKNLEERALKNVTLYGKEKRIFFAREFEIETQTLYDIIVIEDKQGQTAKSKLTGDDFFSQQQIYTLPLFSLKAGGSITTEVEQFYKEQDQA